MSDIREPPNGTPSIANNSKRAHYGDRDRKPSALPVNADGIPAELKARRQWVCWRLTWKEDQKKKSGKWDKPPISPRHRKHASSTDPGTWATFDQAVTCCQSGPEDGIGFVFSADDPFCGIDLDNALDSHGRLKPWAQAIINELDSYVEISPSGTGVKIFVCGGLPGGCKHRIKIDDGEIEVYDRERYFTVTGHKCPSSPATINERQQQLDALLVRVGMVKAPSPSTSSTNGDGKLNDTELIAKAMAARNGAKFRKLWNGDTSDYNGDESRADLALCFELAFWTGGDALRIDALFRQSGRMREKWEREDYRRRTIDKALEGQSEHYHGNASKPRAKAASVPAPSVNGKAEAESFHLTDTGNALRLVKRHGSKLRFCHPWGKWLAWDGRRWTEDATAQAERFVHETRNSLYRETAKMIEQLGAGADGESEEEQLQRKTALKKLSGILQWCLKWEQAKAVTATLQVARCLEGVPILPEELDRDPWLLNVLNGTINLRTGTLRPHRQEDLITKLAPVEYDPEAKCPRWLKFLDRIFDGNQDLISYLQRVIGCCLTGDVGEQSLWFFYGMGANGKSTFLLTILNMLGDYGMQAASDLLIAKKNESHPTERADLFGKRFVATIETEHGKRMAEALMKQMTGGDKMRARKMRQDFFEFDAVHKIFLAANHKPQIKGTDHGTWRRIKLVPFTVTIPENEKDKKLVNKLKAELPGILAWAVRGCLAWQQGGIGEPDVVRNATDTYKAEQDTLAAFIAERCFVSNDSAVRCKVSDFLAAYNTWAGDHDVQRDMGQRMTNKGFEPKRGAKGVTFYVGIALLNESPKESGGVGGVAPG